MKFIPLPLSGAFIIEPELLRDERGFFARSWCRKEFEDHGLNAGLAQCSFSFNDRKGTLRGMHLQAKPHEEAKLVRCTRGALYDVIADLRPGSPTFKQWSGIELSAENHKMLYIPEGFAHGFQTLEDHTEIFYQMSGIHHPESARGLRWDDSVLGIKWPFPESLIVSPKDKDWPPFMERGFV